MGEHIKAFYMWLLCGYRKGCIPATFRAGYWINPKTLRGRFVDWLLDLDFALRRSPNDFRWWLADQLSRAALRLRGQTVSVFGYYDHSKGNRAAELADDLWLAIVMSDINDDGGDNAGKKLQELSSLAGATWFANRDEPHI